MQKVLVGAGLNGHYTYSVREQAAFGVSQAIESIRPKPQAHLGSAIEIRVREHCQRLRLRIRDPRVTTRLGDARLTALLLEPRSSNSILQTTAYRDLLVADQDFFIFREVDCRHGS